MDFLQSEQWRKFQEAAGSPRFGVAGRRTFLISVPSPLVPLPEKGEGDFSFHASIVEHELPIVGRYFYIPRGPVCHPELDSGSKLDSGSEAGMTKLINLAKENGVGWIRFDANNSHTLDIIRENSRVVKAPHDMQPKEVFVIDISKSEEELLAEMKSKTRYNIKLAQKHNVSVKAISKTQIIKPAQTTNYLDEFIKLVKITAERDKITPHPEGYYRQMFAIIPEENIRLYVAEYDGKVIVANIVIFYNDTAIYLHGASDNEYRNVMAPYLLQWQQILDAKKAGCVKYDFGGISTNYESNTNIRITNSWSGITKFKLGFSQNTKPVEFLGSYDIVINPMKYYLYRIIQKVKSFL